MILTIGHSTHALGEFVSMLRSHDVKRLIDVRTVPRSARNPQFNKESLPGAVLAVGIDYTHLPALGGLRKPRSDSVNGAWGNDSFRGYADYMGTPEFEHALAGLIELGLAERCCTMCAEAEPHNCHRSLIADALCVRGVPVAHILAASNLRPHTITAFARVSGTRVTYPSLGI